MKNSIKVLVVFAISLAFVFTACNKEKASSKSNDDTDMFKSAANTEVDLMLKGDGDFEKVITKPLVKIEGCDYIVEGTIEYYKDGELVATIDYGDGECDDIATKTVDGTTTEFSLKKKDDDWYYKVITEPIVKLEDCEYIVAGVIDFYSKKDNSWLATINFGDGTCDEWATKITDDGTFEFSMKDWGYKEKP
ncbi:MAG: hypothetical protein B6D61_11895 [Bacteroidetes bacterium 4484_249]|nr:MAG: hypothetical protein B6D61_11895 [Bacteroidetes bacterium 4484_249]